MKTLDLSAYGVSEMNKQEMQETDGGWIKALVGAVLFQIAMEIIDGTFVDSVRAGYSEQKAKMS